MGQITNANSTTPNNELSLSLSFPSLSCWAVLYFSSKLYLYRYRYLSNRSTQQQRERENQSPRERKGEEERRERPYRIYYVCLAGYVVERERKNTTATARGSTTTTTTLCLREGKRDSIYWSSNETKTEQTEMTGFFLTLQPQLSHHLSLLPNKTGLCCARKSLSLSDCPHNSVAGTNSSDQEFDAQQMEEREKERERERAVPVITTNGTEMKWTEMGHTHRSLDYIIL